MKISGCTFINKGVQLGYPFIESIRSALHLVDEFVIALGPDTEEDRALIEAIGDDRIRIIDTTWSPDAPKGFVYSQQTMVALYNCTGDWALSLQGDEAIHEDDCSELRALVARAHADGRADGISMPYHHFYGRPDLIATGPRWYRREARLVRMAGRRVIVPSDAQYLVNISGRRRLSYLKAVRSDARIYHYGWTRALDCHVRKIESTAEFWQEKPRRASPYETMDPSILKPFTGTHPAEMAPWISESANRDFEPDPDFKPTRKDRRYRLKGMLERMTGLDLSTTHFRPIKL
jgi:hypothetical protein